MAYDEPKHIDKEEKCGQNYQSARFPFVLCFVKFERKQNTIPNAQKGQRSENQKTNKVIQQVLVVFGWYGSNEPLEKKKNQKWFVISSELSKRKFFAIYLGKRAQLFLNCELKTTNLTSIRIRLWQPFLQTRSMNETHCARTIARMQERLTAVVGRVANAAQNRRV